MSTGPKVVLTSAVLMIGGVLVAAVVADQQRQNEINISYCTVNLDAPDC